MARYPLNLPTQLKEEAEQYAVEQGVSLNQFILWAVSEKVGNLKQKLDDPRFPHVTYQRRPSGLAPVIRGTALRVQVVYICVERWGMSTAEVAAEYGLQLAQVEDALQFAREHRSEIEAAIAEENELERRLATPDDLYG